MNKSMKFAIILGMCFSGLLFYGLGNFLFYGKSILNQMTVPEKGYAINAKISECKPLARFPEPILKYCAGILNSAYENNLDPVLVAAVIFIESGGDEEAVSHSGAIGLMQVMPRDGIASTFICKNGPCFTDRPSSQELREPAYNISYGTHLLADLILLSGSVRDGLKMYGPIQMDYQYADRVISIMGTYR